MKKILLAVMAVAAIGFTASCGNKTQQAEAVDSVAIIDSLAGAEAQNTIDGLSALLEAGDATKVQECLVAIKEKIAALVKENPEVAKEYVAKVQTFLKDNADKVKAVVGENAAAAAALTAVTEVEPATVVSNLIGDAKDAAVEKANEVKDAAVEKAEAAKDAAVQAAQDKANEAKEAAKDKANEAVDAAADKAKKALGL